MSVPISSPVPLCRAQSSASYHSAVHAGSPAEPAGCTSRFAICTSQQNVSGSHVGKAYTVSLLLKIHGDVMS